MGALNQKGGEGSDNQSELSRGRAVGKGTPLPLELGGRACAERGAGCAGGDAAGGPPRAAPAPSGACAAGARLGPMTAAPVSGAGPLPSLQHRTAPRINSAATPVCHPLKAPPPPRHTHIYIGVYTHVYGCKYI